MYWEINIFSQYYSLHFLSVTSQLKFQNTVQVICTEGALRRPLTYDNHPFTEPQNEPIKPLIIPGRPPMN